MTNQTVSTFVADLRELRRRNGMPSYAELARRTGCPRSTLHDALRGDRLPALELTKAFVKACGEPGEVWEKRWVEAAAELDTNRPKPSDQRPDTYQPPATGQPPNACPPTADPPPIASPPAAGTPAVGQPPNAGPPIADPPPIASPPAAGTPAVGQPPNAGPPIADPPPIASPPAAGTPAVGQPPNAGPPIAGQPPVAGLPNAGQFVASPPAAGQPPVAGRRPARFVRLPVVIAAVGLAAAGGAVAVWASTGSCEPTREYVVSQKGAVLDATGVPVGEVLEGDVVQVASLAHDRYPHRYFATVTRTNVNGYVDEAKLTFNTTTCR